MLDVDNTITDRIDETDNHLITKLLQEGYHIEKFDFQVNKHDHFFNYYRERLIRHNKPFCLNTDCLNIHEVVVIRPAINKMLQSIIDLGKSLHIPVHILICSRKDDTRTNALINSLNFSVDGKLFKDLVDIVPRDFFRVEIVIDDKKTPSKSAKLLREKYAGRFGKITANDYIVLIDQLPDNRFIISNPKKDFNAIIPAFEVGNREVKFDLNSDQNSMDELVQTVQKLLK